MTDHPTPFDPAAFLSECARVHEAASNGRWIVERGDFSGRNWLIAQLGDSFNNRNVHVTTENVHASETNGADADDDATAIAHYHNTYAALLDVARGLVEHRGFVALAAEHPSMSEANRLQARREVTELDAILAPLSRLAAAGGGR